MSKTIIIGNIKLSLKMIDNSIGFYEFDSIGWTHWMINITSDEIYTLDVIGSIISYEIAVAILHKEKEIVNIIKKYSSGAIFDYKEHTITFGDNENNFVIYGIDSDDLSIICGDNNRLIYYNNINEIIEIPVVQRYFSINKIAQQYNE